MLRPDEPEISLQDIESWCGLHFGLRGTATRLAGEIDLNFRLIAEDGTSCVVKLSHAAEDPAVLDFQNAALRQIASRHPDLPVPRVIPTREGHFVARAGQGRLLRLLSWLDGTPLHTVPVSNATRRNVGALSAAIAIALDGFSHPAERRSLRWDMTQASALAGKLALLKPDMRQLVQPAFDRFCDGFMPKIGRLRSGVVHNDLNLFNLLVDSRDQTSLSGCIDFGDLVRVPLVIDLAIAAAYQANGPDPVGSIITMAKGYHAVLPLRPEELDWLVDLAAMRAAMTIIITHWTSQQDPVNAPYLLRNEPAARALLEALADIPPHQARARVRDEIGSAP